MKKITLKDEVLQDLRELLKLDVNTKKLLKKLKVAFLIMILLNFMMAACPLVK